MAMMIHAKIPQTLRYKLWREAYQTATLIDSLVLVELYGRKATRIEHWGKPIPSFAYVLRTWGEAGVVKTKSKMSAKLENRGTTCMLVGYSTMHAQDVYRMWDPNTERIHISRDIIWLKRMYFESKQNKEITTNQMDQIDDETAGEITEDNKLIGQEDIPSIIEKLGEENNNEEIMENEADDNIEADRSEEIMGNDTEDNVEADRDISSFKKADSPTTIETSQQLPPVRVTKYGRVTKVPAYLRDDMGLMSLSAAEKAYQNYIRECSQQNMSKDDYNIDYELAGVGAGIGGGFKNTKELRVMTYGEAMLSKDKEKWLQAIGEEYQRMVSKQVWEPVRREKVPGSAKILTTTWAMKKKSNGTFCARLNARGYEQVDGEHYDSTSIHAPVVNDTTVRIIMVLGIMAHWMSHLVDVQGAFLNGNLKSNE